MLLIKSFQTHQLNKSLIKKILNLKNQTWKYGLVSQKKHFNKNVKKKDIHNLVFIKSNLAGYTLLSKKNLKIKNKVYKILYLDSFVVDTKYRGKKIASLLMNFNNHIILDNDYFCILSCDNKMIKFYKKFSWSKINRGKKFIKNIKPNLNKMCFNKKKIKYL